MRFPAAWSRVKRPALSLLIAAHFATMMVWTWPRISGDNPIVRLISPHLRLLRLDQNWFMFAWPQTFGYHVVATIGFLDGTTLETVIPMRPEAGLWERYRLARSHHKWANAIALYDTDPNPHLWKDYARYLARMNARRGPVWVTLTCERSAFPPPFGAGPDHRPTTKNRYTYFTYRVTPENLR